MMSAFALAWVGLGAGVAVCDASDGLAVVWLPPGLAQATLVNVNKMTVTRRFIARVTERAEAGYKRCSKACGYCPTGVGEGVDPASVELTRPSRSRWSMIASRSRCQSATARGRYDT